MSAPRILIIDDDKDMRDLMADEFAHEGLEAVRAGSGQEAMQILAERRISVIVTDLRMPGVDGMEVLRIAHEMQPRIPVIITTGYGSVPSAVDAMRTGAFEYLCKPFAIPDLVAIVRKAIQSAGVHVDIASPQGKESLDQVGDLIGTSKAMAGVFDLIKRAAATDINVLITGESGTGKELVAKAIHANSDRKRARFVPVNCAGLPESLLESELLGHVRGAFTGAITSRKGLIEEASGGTLFLDEIAEMPIVLQAKLLRVLQDKAVRPVGSNRAQVMDFRLITATNKDPNDQVAAGALRDDLLFRLNVINIALPPLRERGKDLRLLVDHLIKKHAVAQHSAVNAISAEALAYLEAYSWPGNVRELENTIERAIALTQSETIQAADLPACIRERRGATPDAAPSQARTLKEVQEEHIARVLDETGGDREDAARILGVHPRTLRRRDRRLEDDRSDDGSPPSLAA